ncbi:MAG: IPT/TIG domain-containing protein [Actinomycetota bacterium]|nr:IPT/TIG domain-containing protein [Actinomycetota bacterium]
MATTVFAVVFLSGIIMVMAFAFSEGSKEKKRPTVSAVSSAWMSDGPLVIIDGRDFGHESGRGGVYFAGEPAEVEYWSDTSINVRVPSGFEGGKYSITVENVAGTSDSIGFELAESLVLDGYMADTGARLEAYI